MPRARPSRIPQSYTGSTGSLSSRSRRMNSARRARAYGSTSLAARSTAPHRWQICGLGPKKVCPPQNLQVSSTSVCSSRMSWLPVAIVRVWVTDRKRHNAAAYEIAAVLIRIATLLPCQSEGRYGFAAASHRNGSTGRGQKPGARAKWRSPLDRSTLARPSEARRPYA